MYETSQWRTENAFYTTCNVWKLMNSYLVLKKGFFWSSLSTIVVDSNHRPNYWSKKSTTASDEALLEIILPTEVSLSNAFFPYSQFHKLQADKSCPGHHQLARHTHTEWTQTPIPLTDAVTTTTTALASGKEDRKLFCVAFFNACNPPPLSFENNAGNVIGNFFLRLLHVN